MATSKRVKRAPMSETVSDIVGCGIGGGDGGGGRVEGR